jgi:hypothetical protein
MPVGGEAEQRDDPVDVDHQQWLVMLVAMSFSSLFALIFSLHRGSPQ